MRFVCSAIIFTLTSFSLPVMAKDEAVVSLAKTSKWEMKYDLDSCHLLSKFGQGEQTATMRITRFEPGSSFDLMLYGPMFGSEHAWQHAKIQFGEMPQFGVESVGAGATTEKLPFVILTGLRLDADGISDAKAHQPDVSQSVELKTTSITIRLPQGKAYRLETGSLGASMAAMRTCTDDLVAHWGYDPATMAHLSKPATPIGSPARWVTSADVPMAALSARQNGMIKFRLDVDETGKINECHVLRRFKPNEFDVLTCKLILTRGKFTPALDQAGAPVKSFYISAVRFVIPSD